MSKPKNEPVDSVAQDLLRKSVRQILLNIRRESPVGSSVRKQANAALRLMK